MGIVTFFKGLIRRESPAAQSAPSPRTGGGGPMWLNIGGNDMSVATVFRCVRFIAEAVANLPLQYQKKRGGVYVVDEESRLNYLLTIEPNPNINAFDFWRQAVQNMLLDGNAYILPQYVQTPGGIELTSLILCSRGTVSHDTEADTYSVNDPINRISGTFYESEILHIKNIASAIDPKRGISTLTYARRCINISAAADTEQLKRFESGGIIRGIVSNGNSVKGFGEYQDRELEKTAESIDDQFHNQHVNIVTVPGQVDFRQLSMSSADMQFLESRKFGVLEICRFFGVNPSFVYADTSSNYKSVEQANVAFLSHTLNPLLRNIELELQRKLILPAMSSNMQIRFDRKGIYACDLDGLMKYRNSLLQTGCTVNELRRMENLAPVDGGDYALVSANLKSIKEISNPSLPDNE